MYITEDFGASEFPHSTGKLECLENAELGSYHRVEGEARESNGVQQIDTPPPVQHSFGGFRRVSSGVRYEALFFNLQ